METFSDKASVNSRWMDLRAERISQVHFFCSPSDKFPRFFLMTNCTLICHKWLFVNNFVGAKTLFYVRFINVSTEILTSAFRYNGLFLFVDSTG